MSWSTSRTKPTSEFSGITTKAYHSAQSEGRLEGIHSFREELVAEIRTGIASYRIRLNISAKPSRIHQLVVVAVVAAWGLAIPMAAAFFERIMEASEERAEGLYYQSAYIPY